MNVLALILFLVVSVCYSHPGDDRYQDDEESKIQEKQGPFGPFGAAIAPVVGAVIGPLLVNIANGITNGITTGLVTGYQPLLQQQIQYGQLYDAYLVTMDGEPHPYVYLRRRNEDTNQNLTRQNLTSYSMDDMESTVKPIIEDYDPVIENL